MIRIKSLTLYVHRPAVLAKWYEALGFAVRKRGMVYHVAAGYSDLRLIPGEEEAWFHFAFHVRGEAFERVVQQLESKVDLLPVDEEGSKIIEFESWKARAVYAHDPAGNIVEWITRPDHEWRDIAAPMPDIPGLAEIGLPVPDIGIYRHKASLFLSIWKSSGEEFTALGNEEGLVIMVPEGRGWLPTDRPAKFFPCSAVFEKGGRRAVFNTQDGKVVWSR